MVARQIHLVRHGEVFNPEHVLYGRLPGFGLSKLGHRMARAAADDLAERARPVAAVFASPLQRTQESAEPIAELFELVVGIEPRIIEPHNRFEGMKMPSAMWHPRHWLHMRNPMRPSWGEAYRSISSRMLLAMADAWRATDDGDVVLVSHQLPIWTVHQFLAGDKLYHDPRKRRCHLSSITTFEAKNATAAESPTFIEVAYTNPAHTLLAHATDMGAA